MALRRQRSPQGSPQGFTAATVTVPLGAGSSWKTWKFGNRDWQIEGWRLYDITPEHRFLAGWIGDSVSQARLYVAEVGETGEETQEVTETRIARLAAVPLGTGAQRDDNLRLAGIDLAVGGECWIVGEGAAEDPETAEGSWFVVTGSAFKQQGDAVKVRRPKVRGGDWLELADGVDILIRCWRPHPNDVDQADSPTRSAIVPLRAIELLTKREFAELDSRLTGAGMWFLPEGIDFPRAEGDPEGIAGFMAYVQRGVAKSMQDQGQASSMVPSMATVPDQFIEHLDKLKPTTFWSELSEHITPMKKEAIIRVAGAFEVPNEILTGLADANHWSGWLISEEGIRRIKPYLATIADALTRGFLQLALDKMGVANPDRYAFRFDVGPLAARPNRLDEALQLRALFLLSDEETVKAGAFSVDQMPTQQERAMQLVMALVQTRPELLVNPAIQQLLGLPSITLPGAIEGGPGGGPPALEEDPADGPPEDDEMPDQDDGVARSRTGLALELDHRISQLAVSPRQVPLLPQQVFNAASKLLVIAALERAGARLTSAAERRKWAGVPRHELHTRIGPVTPERAERVLFDAWAHVPAAAKDLEVDPDQLTWLLNTYCTEMLTRGMAHHDDFLHAMMSRANQGRGPTKTAELVPV